MNRLIETKETQEILNTTLQTDNKERITINFKCTVINTLKGITGTILILIWQTSI